MAGATGYCVIVAIPWVSFGFAVMYVGVALFNGKEHPLYRGRFQTFLSPAFGYIGLVVPIVTAVIAGVYGFSADARTCLSELQWKHWFQNKDDGVIRSIQEKFCCCGFNSMRDRAWPFPSRGAAAVKTKPPDKHTEPSFHCQDLVENRFAPSESAASDLTSTDLLNDGRVISLSSHGIGGYDNVEAWMQQNLTAFGLFEHRFIRLTQYSLLRALLQNASILDLAPHFIADDEALSPWTISNPYTTLAPHTLRPTLLQLCMPHHPYLDVLAPPRLRENILAALFTDEEEERICYALHHDSFTVWGEQSWNAMGKASRALFMVTFMANAVLISMGGFAVIRR
ncbi:hypothetical protein LTR05_008596 [Lithohypha guttulata]|uniref:Uncharacterized protein n=1 Tax=Lithohypha guttulata TaxID=1690604 RepID=A0AAN7PJQ9_9EURO|nr:hypothetical protein LTR05_008596 [Lithohypha guttulata]